jgi:penicillin-insensitive murein endopeptidase
VIADTSGAAARAALLALACLALAVPWRAGWAQPAAAWAAAPGPAPGPPRIIGGTSLGCIAGAQAPLPAGPVGRQRLRTGDAAERGAADDAGRSGRGSGWQAVRVSRNRHWGHPSLLAFVQEIAARASAKGFPPLWIGDMAQPRGGPMPYGHVSHQTGLDVDIWLDVTPRPATLPIAAREAIEVPSLVRPDETGIDPARFTARHAALIRLAAEGKGVDRVLVHHAIKRELCRLHRGEAWLRRVRPWRGHDSHMHIRLRCPNDQGSGQPDCQDIAPPPPSDGCDASLDWWLTEEARRPPPRPPGPPPALPAACAAVLQATGSR